MALGHALDLTTLFEVICNHFAVLLIRKPNAISLLQPPFDHQLPVGVLSTTSKPFVGIMGRPPMTSWDIGLCPQKQQS
jgi:hypothetical protein